MGWLGYERTSRGPSSHMLRLNFGSWLFVQELLVSLHSLLVAMAGRVLRGQRPARCACATTGRKDTHPLEKRKILNIQFWVWTDRQTNNVDFFKKD